MNRFLVSMGAVACLAIGATIAVSPKRDVTAKLIHAAAGAVRANAAPKSPAKIGSVQSASNRTLPEVAQQYAKLPLAFEPNLGQGNQAAKFLARGNGYSIFLTGNETVLTLPSQQHLASTRGNVPSAALGPNGHVPVDVVRMQFVGANAGATLSAQDALPGKSNYFVGPRERWRTNVPTYRKVVERGVYNGIDLVYYGNQRQLEYDVVLAPGADPQAVVWSIDGARKLRVGADGDLILDVDGSQVRLQRPIAYQMQRGVRQPVSVNYVLKAKDHVALSVGNYDSTQTLVVDPVLSYSTYLGGSNIDGANAIAVASDKTAFVAGETFSADFPVDNSVLSRGYDGAGDAFVSKLSADGSTLIYSSYLGGSLEDVANGIAVDNLGNAYVAGWTLSGDYPVTSGVFDSLCGGDGKCGATLNSAGAIVSNGFISKLNPEGSGLIYSTFLGGYEDSRVQAITVDSNEIAYVTGATGAAIRIDPSIPDWSSTTTYNPGDQVVFDDLAWQAVVASTGSAPSLTNASWELLTDIVLYLPFPTTTEVNTPSAVTVGSPGFGGGATDAFVTAVSPTGTNLLYSTYIGGSAEDVGYGIATDGAGNAFMTGLTYSSDFTLTVGKAFQTAYAGNGDAFAAKLNTNGLGTGSLLYSSFLGGAGLDQGNGVAVDSSGNMYITGLTNSSTLTVAPATARPYKGQGDAFVAKFNPSGSGAGSRDYFTYLGGSLADEAFGVAVDSSGDAYVTGSTVSTDFPITAGVFQPSYGGGNADAFVTELGPTGATLVYSTFLGGTSTDIGYGIAVDSTGAAYVAGQTCSVNFPLANPEQAAPGGNCDAFVSKITIPTSVALNPAGLVFAPQSLNTTSAAESVTVTNDSPDTQAVTVGALGGTDPQDFAETGAGTCGASISLTPGQTCTITATFTPTAAGTLAASILVTATDTTLSTTTSQTLSLTGTTAALALSTSSVAFGNQTVGVPSNSMMVTATNAGNSAIGIASVQASGDFSESDNCTKSALQPGTDCVINVIYTPAAVGSSTGALTLTDNAPGSPQIVLLTGTGVASPTLTLSTLSLNFGNQTVGVASSAQTVTATTSAGTADVTISSIVASGAFSETDDCTRAALPPSTNCTVNVTFMPQATGTAAGALTITYNAPGSPQVVALSGIGVTTNAALTLSPGTLTFGNQTVGVPTAAQTVTATNAGSSAIAISSISASGDFSETDNCTKTALQPNTNCFINVTYTPSAVGTAAGALTVTAGGSSQVVSLNGAGVAATATLSLAPANLSFGDQTVGTSSSVQSVTVTNTGTTTVTISAIIPSGAFTETDNCTKAGLPPNTNCTIGVTFTPQAAGSAAGALTIVDNVPGGSQLVPLSGTGVAASSSAALTISSAALSFGNQTVGVPSNTRPVTLTNAGTTPVTISTIVASGAFTEADNCIKASLEPGDSCTVNVTFTPAATGATTGSLTISDNVAGSPQIVNLSGTGAAALTFLPGALLFGNQTVGVTSAAQTLTVANTGTTPVTISTIAASGAFAEADDCTKAGLQPGTNCTISVTFTPQAAGGAAGALTITDNAPGSPQTISLTGTGVSAVTLALSPASLTFGNQTVGTPSAAQTVRATNSSTGLVTVSSIAASGDFTETDNCTAAPLAASANCVINVVYTPSSIGTGTGAVTLTINGNTQTVPLAGTGVAATYALTLSATNLPFGSQAVGSASNPSAFTITNTNTTPVAISSIVATGAFSETDNCTKAALQTSGSCTVNVVFTPAAAGTTAGAVTITADAPGSPQAIQLTGTGVATASLTLSPASLSFGNQTIGVATAAQAITATNMGSAPVTLSGIAASGAFSETDNCASATLQPNTSCTINVVFTPAAAGVTTGAVTITDNTPGSPQVVSLSGTGVVAALTLSPTTLNFGSATVGVASTPLTVTATNTGTTPVAISSIVPSGAFTESDDCVKAALQPGTNCTISVAFTPQAAGAALAALTISDNVPGSPQIVSLSGTGVAPTTMLTFSPTSLSFGNQTVGVASSAMTVTATSTGTAPVAISGIGASGAFTESDNCTKAALQPGTNCTIAIVFTPAATGPTTGALTVADNVTGSPQTIALTGTGTGSTTALTLSPSSLAFGSQPIGVASNSQAVTVTNTGSTPITISGIAASGAFSEADNCTKAALPVGTSCTINVVFTPSATGGTIGALTIADNAAGSPQQVSLSGTGVAPSFTVTAVQSSATVPAGDTASFAVVVASVGGFSQPVLLSCTGLPVGASCVAAPNPVMPIASPGTAAAITISTALRASVPTGTWERFGGPRDWRLGPGLLLASIVLLLLAAGARAAQLLPRPRAMAMFGCAAVLALVSVGCGSAGTASGTPTGTPAGTYSVTVVGTSTGTAQSVATVTLKVQ